MSQFELQRESSAAPMGIEIGGADEIDTVSVILNRSGGRFKSLGRKIGWALAAEDQKEATPQVAPTTAGS